MIYICFFLFFLSLLSKEELVTHPFILSVIKNKEEVDLIKKEILVTYEELIEKNFASIHLDDITNDTAYHFFRKTFLIYLYVSSSPFSASMVISISS